MKVMKRNWSNGGWYTLTAQDLRETPHDPGTHQLGHVRIAEDGIQITHVQSAPGSAQCAASAGHH